VTVMAFRVRDQPFPHLYGIVGGTGGAAVADACQAIVAGVQVTWNRVGPPAPLTGSMSLRPREGGRLTRFGHPFEEAARSQTAGIDVDTQFLIVGSFGFDDCLQDC
jgi:hypothetical protein